MTQTLTAQTWRQVIIPLEIQCDYENPFLDVSIMATFDGPDGRCIKREAYWDGGRSYKIAFAPTKPGEWQWKISAPKCTGIHNESGLILCTQYDGDLAIYQHGFIKADSSGRFLTYQDGTPFFWLGDTHWAFAFGERFDESNHPEMRSMFKGMADRRVQQGFNVYQTNLRSDPGYNAEKLSCYWTKDGQGTLPNVAFYKNELDRRMYYLADIGLVNALGFGWFMSIIGNIPLWKNMARYMVARYGALPMVWTLAGEVAGYAPEPMRTGFIDSWREVAVYISQIDSYGTLQTAHYDNTRPFSDYYYDEDWYDFTLNQAGHGDFPINAADFYTYKMAHPNKPFVEGESLYEFCSTLEENGSRLCTADMLRRVAYTAIQTGACGYTYGAQGIWDNVWEAPKAPDPFSVFNRFGIPWHEAIDGIGAVQMGYMKTFYEQEHFENLKPVPVSAVTPFGVHTDESLYPMARCPLGLVSDDRSHIIIYYNDMTQGGCQLTDMLPKTYTANWFNPRTGQYSIAVPEFTPENGFWEAPNRPEGNDWLLSIKTIN